MDLPQHKPEMLGEFEATWPRRVRWWTWLGLALWLLLLAGDWVARFCVFRWQDQWMPIPKTSASMAGKEAPARSQLVPAQTGGGDLTKMLPVHWIAARYAEFHPGYIEFRDNRGFINESSPGEVYYPVVMLGDSFMISGGTQNVAQVLSALGGIPVYNHAVVGRAAFPMMEKFLLSNRFDPPPQVVVWNLVARELRAPLFLRQPVDAWFQQINTLATNTQDAVRTHIRWDQLMPSVLRTALPDTSLMAYLSGGRWAEVKWVLFHEWPRNVLGADDPQFGPMLFYRENLRTLPLLTPEVDSPAVVQTVLKVAQGLQKRKVKLVILLVPEKEQIHIQALPARDQRALRRGPELLAEIEMGLRDAGVPVVNLMPVFQEATAQGRRLYWRDDTHWNDAGIRLAAEELWREVAPLLE